MVKSFSLASLDDVLLTVDVFPVVDVLSVQAFEVADAPLAPELVADDAPLDPLDPVFPVVDVALLDPELVVDDALEADVLVVETLLGDDVEAEDPSVDVYFGAEPSDDVFVVVVAVSIAFLVSVFSLDIISVTILSTSS